MPEFRSWQWQVRGGRGGAEGGGSGPPRSLPAAACHSLSPQGTACGGPGSRACQPGITTESETAAQAQAGTASDSKSQAGGSLAAETLHTGGTASASESVSGFIQDFSKRVKQTLAQNHRTKKKKNQHSPVPLCTPPCWVLCSGAALLATLSLSASHTCQCKI